MTDMLTEPQDEPRGTRRWALVGTGGLAVVAVVGGAAWAVSQLVATGSAPATAVPADALAYVALDLDPGAGQKVEALRTLNRFPALAERLGDREELKSALLQAVLSEAPCDDLTVEGIEEWLGDRLALAVVPGAEGPAPVLTVQVTDQEAARAGVRDIAACGTDGADAELPGMAFLEEYLVLAEDDATAQAAAEAAEQDALEGDDGYARWVEEAGGAGILTGYVAPDAPAAFADEWASGAVMPWGGADPDQVEEAMAGFEGAGFALRFADGGIEAQAAGHVPGSPAGGGDNGLARLPGSTGVALGFGVSDGFADALVETLNELDPQLETMVESETGLALPEDLQTLLGDGVALAVDSSLDPAALGTLGLAGDQLPVGIRIVGDPTGIVPVLERLMAAAGAEGEVVVREGDGAVAVGLAPGYVEQLAAGGDLGASEAFERSLPDYAENAGAMFVDFDSGEWFTAPDEELQANLEPMSSLGMSVTVDDEVARGRLRLDLD